MAVLMPMTLALASASGPPELPGLIGASVWMRPVSVPTGDSSSRSRPLTMPDVTVCWKPKGLPRAMAVSPTSTLPGLGQGRRHQLGRGRHGDDGEVPLGSTADDPAGELLLVSSAHRHLVGAGHDVVGGEDETGAVVDDARAQALADLDLHDGRAERLGHVLHARRRTGVGGAATVGVVGDVPDDSPWLHDDGADGGQQGGPAPATSQTRLRPGLVGRRAPPPRRPARRPAAPSRAHRRRDQVVGVRAAGGSRPPAGSPAGPATSAAGQHGGRRRLDRHGGEGTEAGLKPGFKGRSATTERADDARLRRRCRPRGADPRDG